MVSDDNRGTVATNNKYLSLKGIYLIESQKMMKNVWDKVLVSWKWVQLNFAWLTQLKKQPVFCARGRKLTLAWLDHLLGSLKSSNCQ